ncbi:hypothetical protein DACRYDRAFT_91301 [Dacryopinax primogenitus]|uniref:Amino acid transporter transmembrane domain-containing protein n=1 Tax=Dacryopinax primogenitus (strain DJM 731) TaxID=1858805 RepID=M5FNR4_DACPD|nr:uncharacterized protein DACRYDRAFT_91301 [Dacryopinax primogenitus]EJT97835.1 hypothetical protein DACRYDRAFT_91301 [Dacryopinax primogenitus]
MRSQRLSSVSYATLSRRPSVRHRASWGVLKSQDEAPIAEAPGGGTSTFGQSLFNCIAILLGVGVLSESVAFTYAAWIGGFVLLGTYGILTYYTAKILVRIMALDVRINSYADIARVAFGPRSIWLTISMFCLELFTLSVILVLLFSDTLHELVLSISSDMWKIIGLAFVLPTCFLPLNLLAFTSILGILSIVLLVSTVLINGFSITSTPGSLLRPAPTSLLPDWPRLPIAFGLLMDLCNPERFDSMITWAYVIATVLYGVIASAGYLMFGNAVSDEVSKDLVNTPGYPRWLNIVMAVGLVINPLSKYALCTRPLSTTIESLLGIGNMSVGADPHTSAADSSDPKSSGHKRLLTKQTLYIVLTRVVLSLVVVLTAILIPSFSIVMSFLGAFSAFLLCVIGPVCAKCAVEGRWKWYDVIILVVASSMAISGTIMGFWTSCLNEA